jgi:multidrug efflux pump subunit AcrA (membrane-fusion protein)
MKKKVIYAVIFIVIVIVIWFFTGTTVTDKYVKVKPQYGQFVITVTVNGELDAEKSVNIKGPGGLRAIRIYNNIKIEDLIPEGTVVDSGAYIGRLDKTPVMNKLKEVDANLEKLSGQINKSKIDSALDLRAARDQLINQRYAIEEKEIELKNSKYEPPAVQRKVQIDLEKAKRQYNQSLQNYKLKKDKQINIIQSAIIDYNKGQTIKDQIMEVLDGFTVKAPQAGMVIYAKSWNGKKKVPGSDISPWNPIIATLPDLSTMLVKSFVNEIDISKIKVGQKVEISVDAFPEKKLSGKVKSVANIGEELANSSAHVFEVVISVNESDPDLRPSMTTKNIITTSVIDSVLYIPLECLHSNDTAVFVYTNGVKKIIETGENNEDNIIVTKGLTINDDIYLSEPENADDWEFLKN